MNCLLKIQNILFLPGDRSGRSIDMTGRCAFALCTEGEIDIKMMNVNLRVTEMNMFACLPFINLEVINVIRPTRIVFGFVLLSNVPQLINRWVNTRNLLALQSRPMVNLSEEHFRDMVGRIQGYEKECKDSESIEYNDIHPRIMQEIILLESRLIVARVIRHLFSNLDINVKGHNHRDIVFQQFMLKLFNNFREHRDVHFYAGLSGVSMKYFSTIVREVSGSSPSKWIETIVTGDAKSMLKDRSRNIKDIASALNFPDSPTFSKYFHRVVGLTPMEYRKAIE